MKFTFLLLCFTVLVACSSNETTPSDMTPHVVTTKVDSSLPKLWDLRDLVLIKKDSLWHFETKQGRTVLELGNWSSIESLAFNYRYQTIVPIESDTTGFFLRSRFKDNRPVSYYMMATDKNGIKYLIPHVSSHYYRVATSLDELDAQTEALFLQDTALAELPSKLFAHTQLKAIILIQTQLKALPVEISQLQQLAQLHIKYNQDNLKATSCPLNKLSNLRVLDLSYTSLDSAHANLQLKGLEQLEHLNLRGSDLDVIPQDIFALYNLVYLNLSNNYHITKLPMKIGNLTKLSYLNLAGMKITRLPKTIESLVNLSYINTNNTGLISLGMDLNKLPKLQSFYTTYSVENRIKEAYPDIDISAASPSFYAE
ncbi:MAG: leucine-rich repeat domain-containing protein [Saprospiraceae bacterium]|nr:leucine-rich repeat domain-containing protein [Saprospiraceae bacterium]